MLINPYYVQIMREEYERRAHAYRLQKIALEAQRSRPNTLDYLVAQGLRRVTRRGQTIVLAMRWLLPAVREPKAQTRQRINEPQFAKRL